MEDDEKILELLNTSCEPILTDLLRQIEHQRLCQQGKHEISSSVQDYSISVDIAPSGDPKSMFLATLQHLSSNPSSMATKPNYLTNQLPRAKKERKQNFMMD